MQGSQVNAERLFDSTSGRSFIAAIDHGLQFGVVRGGEDARAAVTTVVRDCAPDGLLIAPGLLARYGELFASRQAPVPICRVDMIALSPHLQGTGDFHRVVCSATEAAALGAGAIVTYLVLGQDDDACYADNVAHLAALRQEAHAIGMPLVVEAVDWGRATGDGTDPELVAYGCRLAAELGADVIKTAFTGDAESMRAITDSCPAPVLVLGGPQAESEAALLDDTRAAIDGGARGVVYGRNVWQADDPPAISSKIREIVHA